MTHHSQLKLRPFARGFHLITEEVLRAIPQDWPRNGLLHIFIQHTSAGICINENADPTVLQDFEMVFDRMVPESGWPYRHTMEGPDDMPAHIKSVLCGTSVSIPFLEGQLALGIWQGIYLCECRNNGGRRTLVISLLS
jgi:secondary thiamine-phosphate synthase enzyme